MPMYPAAVVAMPTIPMNRPQKMIHGWLDGEAASANKPSGKNLIENAVIPFHIGHVARVWSAYRYPD